MAELAFWFDFYCVELLTELSVSVSGIMALHFLAEWRCGMQTVTMQEGGTFVKFRDRY